MAGILTLPSVRRRLGAILLAGTVALLAGCASAPPAPSGEPKPVEVAGPFRHASGLVFPEGLGDFVRVSITQFPSTHDNYGVTYQLGPQRATTVTAFVYPAGSDSLKGHFEAVVASVSQHHRVKPYQLSNVTVTAGGRSIEGKVGSFEFEEPYQGGSNIPLRSHAYVFVSKGWILKYRVTNPAKGDDQLQARVRGLIEALGFPP
jgi:hypothetical protein